MSSASVEPVRQPVSVDAESQRRLAERIALRFPQQWVSEWGGFRFEPEEIIDLADGRRLMWVGRTSGSGLSSGAAVGSECAVLWTLSAGGVEREEVFLDRSQAFAAAGLMA